VRDRSPGRSDVQGRYAFKKHSLVGRHSNPACLADVALELAAIVGRDDERVIPRWFRGVYFHGPTVTQHGARTSIERPLP
jgi:hypothetical protein